MKENSNVQKIYIIILNYNNWQDTIECLENVLRNKYSNYQVIVIDNNSPNNSMEYIKKWVEGELDAWINPEHPLRNLSYPPLKKPIPYVFYTEDEAVKGGNPDLEKSKEETIKLNKNDLNITSKYPVILIQAKENRGYSAGNNIGIKYALAKNDFEYIWLLNNDTVIKNDTLKNLIDCAEKLDKKTSPIGTVLLYYDNPSLVQALGGKFNKFKALGKHLFAKEVFNESLKKKFDINKVDYIIGASMLLRKEFLQKVGLLNEEYFIYFEEIDLAYRAERQGFKPYICLNSIVYHKEAITTKSMPSVFSDFYAMRNRLIFTKKYNTLYTPIVYFGSFILLIKRLKNKEFKKAYNIIKIMFGKRKL